MFPKLLIIIQITLCYFDAIYVLTNMPLQEILIIDKGMDYFEINIIKIFVAYF